MTQHQYAAAAAPTIAHARHRELFEDLMGAVASGFPRRETRSTFRQLAEGLLMELENVNCWTLAEAIGHSGPHRLQHLLSRASWDDETVLDAAAAWAVAALDDGDAVLIADETGDEERREHAGVPEELMFATKTAQTQAEAGVSVLLARRHRYTDTVSYYRCWSPIPVSLARLVGIVCLRWKIEEDFQAAKNTVGLDKGQVTTWRSWHRWSTAALVAYAFLAVATAREAQEPAPAGLELVPLSSFELLRLLRLLILPTPCRDAGHVLHWSAWRRHHQHRARACHQRWHTYADSTP